MWQLPCLCSREGWLTEAQGCHKTFQLQIRATSSFPTSSLQFHYTTQFHWVGSGNSTRLSCVEQLKLCWYCWAAQPTKLEAGSDKKHRPLGPQQCLDRSVAVTAVLNTMFACSNHDSNAVLSLWWDTHHNINAFFQNLAPQQCLWDCSKLAKIC